jgi:uncharacterized membrane protein
MGTVEPAPWWKRLYRRIIQRHNWELARTHARTATKFGAVAGTVAIDTGKHIGRGAQKSAAWAAAIATNPDLTKPLEQWSGHIFNKLSNDYTRSMDGKFVAIGPSVDNPVLDHRILDGHDPISAFQRCLDALPDDSFAQEVSGYLHAMASDMSSVVGLPIMTLTKENLTGITRFCHETGISRSWVMDFMHYNVAELLGAAVPMLMIALNLRGPDKKLFETAAGSIGFGAIASASPIGLIVSLIMLALAIRKARHSGEKVSWVRGIGAGSLKSATLFGATTMLGPIPVVFAILGVIIGLQLKKRGKLPDVEEIKRTIAAAVRATYGKRHRDSRLAISREI